MPQNDLEVFESLTTNSEWATEIDFLTYALFAYQKKEWIEHRLRQTGAAPTQAEIDAWISDLSDFQFRNMRKEAARLFDDSARSYLQEEVEKGKQEALEAAIVKRVEAAGAFWKQLAIALLTSVLAPLILGAIIAGALYWERYPLPSQISEKILPRSSTPDAGQ